MSQHRCSRVLSTQYLVLLVCSEEPAAAGVEEALKDAKENGTSVCDNCVRIMHACVHVCGYVCMYESVYVFVCYAYEDVCLYVCMYMYVCMCVCYVFVCVRGAARSMDACIASAWMFSCACTHRRFTSSVQGVYTVMVSMCTYASCFAFA